MADEASGLAEKVNGVIPFLFFDLIARVAPGLVLLFGINYVCDRQITKAILNVAFNDQAHDASPVAWIPVLLIVGYILGHGISPIVKLLDKKDHEVSQKYNDLRLKFPGVTPIAMRIRAEYIMYGGFAISLVIVLALTLLNQLRNLLINADGLKGWWRSASGDQHYAGALLFWSALVVAWLMLHRNQATIETYRTTVRELDRAAAGLPPVEATILDSEAKHGIHFWIDVILFRRGWRRRLREKIKEMGNKAKPATEAVAPTSTLPAGNTASPGPHPS